MHRWDLSCFYTGVEDPQIDADIQRFADLAKAFYDTHRGHLAETLGQAIRDQVAMDNLSNKIQVYLYLLSSQDTGNQAVKAKTAKADRIFMQAAGEWLNFFDHELVALTDEAIAAQAATDETVQKHLPWIEHNRVFKPHLLAEPVEAALTKRGQFGAGSWGEFFDEVESDLRFPWGDEQKDLTEMIEIVSNDPDTDVRAKALKTINDGLAGHFHKFSAQTLFMVAGAKEVEDRERGYKHPMEGRNKGSKIPDDVVEALHQAVQEVAAPLAQRFYRLKAAHLGLPVLRWSDRNAHMPFADNAKVPWDDAVAIVQQAYASFSPTLAGLVAESFAAGRIDAPAMKGRRGGAYNYSICLEDGTPASFTFLNYLGSNRDVATLAHELGHGVHGLLAGAAQGSLMMHAPMAYAETASIFGENVTFNFLREAALKRDRREALALVMGKLDDVINSVVRQISFSFFERRLHGLDAATMTRAEFERKSPEDLDKIWLEVTEQLYGKPGEVFTYENTEHLWTYISHFHRPFYVYAYAFGELLTQSLYAARERLGDRFEPLYLDMLRTGGTKNVAELLAPFGLDPADPNFWKAGIEVSMGALLKQAEELSAEMGVTIK